MATTIEVEVMYATEAPGSNLYLRKRVGLGAAPTLDRENVLGVILSDITTAARSRRTVDGNDVERRAQAFLLDNSDGAVLARHGGQVALQTIKLEVAWDWIDENSSGSTGPISGLPVTFPKNAIRFFPPTAISNYMKTKALAEAAVDFF